MVHQRNALQRFLGAAADITGGAIDVLRAGVATYQQLSSFAAVRAAATTFVHDWRAPCTPAAEAPAVDAAGRIALLVAGYASSSGPSGIDALRTDDLGYDAADVLRFSYLGGRVPDPAGDLAPDLVGIPAHPYDPADTQGDLRAAGHRLADLVVEVAQTRPGVPIDLYAHSQGGVVARLALLDLANRPGGLDALGAVVTIGTPNDGTDLATIAVQLDPSERQSVEFVNRLAGSHVDATAVSVAQMAETSDVIRELRAAGVPDGVDLRTIGARGDLVVTADHTAVAGHPSAVVDLAGPSAHGDLPGASATTREVALAIAGRPPTCGSILDHVLDAAVPQVVSFAENAVGGAYVIG